MFDLVLVWLISYVQVGRRVGGTWHGHRLILFGFLSQSAKRKTVAVVGSVPQGLVGGQGGSGVGAGDLARFRQVFYGCLSARADALFELTDAVLCSGGPVASLPELSLCGVHRRGHGGMYDGWRAGGSRSPKRAHPSRTRSGRRRGRIPARSCWRASWTPAGSIEDRPRWWASRARISLTCVQCGAGATPPGDVAHHVVPMFDQLVDTRHPPPTPASRHDLDKTVTHARTQTVQQPIKGLNAKAEAWSARHLRPRGVAGQGLRRLRCRFAGSVDPATCMRGLRSGPGWRRSARAGGGEGQVPPRRVRSHPVDTDRAPRRGDSHPVDPDCAAMGVAPPVDTDCAPLGVAHPVRGVRGVVVGCAVG